MSSERGWKSILSLSISWIPSKHKTEGRGAGGRAVWFRLVFLAQGRIKYVWRPRDWRQHRKREADVTGNRGNNNRTQSCLHTLPKEVHYLLSQTQQSTLSICFYWLSWRVRATVAEAVVDHVLCFSSLVWVHQPDRELLTFRELVGERESLCLMMDMMDWCCIKSKNQPCWVRDTVIGSEMWL